MQTVKFKSKKVMVPGKDGRTKEDTQAYVSPTGKAYLPGTVVDVTDKHAAWLEANGWADIVKSAKKKQDKEADERETK
jgi:hypothetical protein